MQTIASVVVIACSTGDRAGRDAVRRTEDTGIKADNAVDICMGNPRSVAGWWYL